MYKKILVTTDVSESSRHALIAALDMGRKFDADVELLHVMYTPMAYVGYGISYGMFVSEEEIQKNGESALEVTLTGIDVSGVRLSTKLVTGHPSSAIVEESKDGFDLIVMGSTGHGPFTGAIIGSVTQRVLAHVDCQVLIVK